jgi:cyclopropane fatty-acyl-phospholipid synthase-like methyltransferase
VEGVSIDAVTISPRQAGIARDAISAAGLSDRIRVHVADYHRLEFDDESFDQVFFFESLYSLDLAALFNGVRRVLRPGGRLYAKEVLRQEHRLSATELAAVGEFEEIFQYKVHRMSDLVSGVEQAGFVDVEAIDLNDQISSAHYQRAMVEFVFGFPLPTEFGRRHWRQFDSAPLLFGELKARNPR